MHPNTEHLVVSLKDSLACGAHFYCLDLMIKTLHAIIAEHVSETFTNADHPKTVLMVIQWALAVRDRLEEDKVPRRSDLVAADSVLLALPSRPSLPFLRRDANRDTRHAVLVSEWI